MSEELQVINYDTDLIVLDEMLGEASLVSRDWDAIIALYNRNNRPCAMRPIDCAKMIDRIKDGQRPGTVFTEFGYSYSAFMARYNKPRAIVEELQSQGRLTEPQFKILEICKADPYFLLGRDIERASAFHLNEGTSHMKKISKGKAIDWKEYLKMVHPEEFKESSENTNAKIEIKLSKGLLEGI